MLNGANGFLPIAWGSKRIPSTPLPMLSPPPTPNEMETKPNRSGLFHSYLFMQAPRGRNSRVAIYLEQALRPLLTAPNTVRFLEEAGFPSVRHNPQHLRKAQEILGNAALVLSINMVQRPSSCPSPLYRLNMGMTGYLNDYPQEVQVLGITGIANATDASRFMQLSSKLLWSMGIQETYLSPRDQEEYLRMLIDASQAPLRLALWYESA